MNGMIFLSPLLVFRSISLRSRVLARATSSFSLWCGCPRRVSCFTRWLHALSKSSIFEQMSLYLTA